MIPYENFKISIQVDLPQIQFPQILYAKAKTNCVGKGELTKTTCSAAVVESSGVKMKRRVKTGA